MSQYHYQVKEKFTIDLKLEVELTQLSNFFQMGDDIQLYAIEDIKLEMVNYLREKLQGSYQQAEVSQTVDYCNFIVI